MQPIQSGRASWQIRKGFPKSGKEDVCPQTLVHLGRGCSQEVLGNVLLTILVLLGASCHSGNGSGIRCSGKSPGDQWMDSRTHGGRCLKVLVFLFRVHSHFEHYYIPGFGLGVITYLLSLGLSQAKTCSSKGLAFNISSCCHWTSLLWYHQEDNSSGGAKNYWGRYSAWGGPS